MSTTASESDTLEDILPQYVEFVKLDNPEGLQQAVYNYMGGVGSESATVDGFADFYGIDLRNFQQFFIEVGLVDSPKGPLISGRVAPILVIRMSSSGHSFTPQVVKCNGFYDTKQKTAWVEATKWDELIKDNLVAEMKETAAKERDRLERVEKHLLRKMEQNGD